MAARAVVPGVAALVAIGWGANQFAPLVVGYQVVAGLAPTTTRAMFVLYAVALVPGLFAGGRLSDRWGRRGVVVVALVVSAGSSLLLVAGSGLPPLLYLGRLLAGLASGVGFSAATAWVKETSHESHGARYAVLAMTAGFALGPGIAGTIAALQPERLWLAYLPHIGASAVALALVARTDSPPRPAPADRAVPAGPGVSSRAAFWRVIVPLAPWVFLTASVALATLPAAVRSTLVGGPLWTAALVTPLPALAGLAAQWPTARMQHLRHQVLTGLGTAAAGLALGALAVTGQSFPLLLAACLVLGLAYGISQTAGLHAIGVLSPPQRLGHSVAVYQSLTYLGYLTPLPIAALTDVVDLTTILTVLAALAVLTAAATYPHTASAARPDTARSATMTPPPLTGLAHQLGMTDLHVDGDQVTATMPVTPDHLAPIDRLHAGAVITLADTACGYGALANLPAGASGFATTSITSHHLSTATPPDHLSVTANLLHGGRTTQTWDATITRDSDGRTVAVVRVLQQILTATKDTAHA